MRRSAFAALFAFGILLPHPATAAPITVSLRPSLATVGVGDIFTVDVAIADVIDLFDYQLDIGFDSTRFAVNGVSDGGFLTSGGGTSVFSFLGLDAPFIIALDNAAGLVTAADSLLGPAPPAIGVTGSGVLARISFLSLAEGVGGLTLANLLFQDSTGAFLEANSFGSSVEALPAPPNPVPEPASLLLVGSGALLFYRAHGFRRRRSSHCSKDGPHEL